jgi:hypothetical protein
VSGTVAFRVTYVHYRELRDDLTQQMARGGLLVKVRDAPALALDAPVALELVLPDGTTLHGPGRVIQLFAGLGVAVSVEPLLVERASQYTDRPEVAATGSARHEWLERAVAHRGAPTRPPPTAAPPSPPTRNEKIQKALHGTRDERNAILRDRDRTLHPFVLKNPQLDTDDVLAIAKNAQVTSDLLKLIGERKDWLQRPAIATALARNPKTPPELAVRALDHVPLEALRQMAKGGVLPHVNQAARKKLMG